MLITRAVTGSGRSRIRASGGDSTVDLNGYRYHIFTTTGSNTLTYLNAASTATVDVFAVGGGGNGGGGGSGGGGGAGGVRLWATYNVGLRTTSAVSVGNRSQNSTFIHNGGTLTAGAGGAGGTANQNGFSGGSGGGGSGDNPASTGGTRFGGAANGLGIGNAGGIGATSTVHYRGGGGGAYSGPGGNSSGSGFCTGGNNVGGNGGTGIAVASLGDISSNSVFSGMTHLASGGGGGSAHTAGIGGPGAGNGGSQANGGNATSFGSGGGGANYFDCNNPQSRSAGLGYQGIVIVRYLLD